MRNDDDREGFMVLLMFIAFLFVGIGYYFDSDSFRASKREIKDYALNNIFTIETVKNHGSFLLYEDAYKTRQKVSENMDEYWSRLETKVYEKPLVRVLNEHEIKLNYASYDINNKKLDIFDGFSGAHFNRKKLNLQIDEFNYARPYMVNEYLAGKKGEPASDEIYMILEDSNIKLPEKITCSIKNIEELKKMHWKVTYIYNFENNEVDFFGRINSEHFYQNVNIPVKIKSIELINGDKKVWDFKI